MITKQEPSLEFVLLHIISCWPISDFLAEGRRVYCATNQVWSYGYMWCLFQEQVTLSSFVNFSCALNYFKQEKNRLSRLCLFQAHVTDSSSVNVSCAYISCKQEKICCFGCAISKHNCTTRGVVAVQYSVVQCNRVLGNAVQYWAEQFDSSQILPLTVHSSTAAPDCKVHLQ